MHIKRISATLRAIRMEGAMKHLAAVVLLLVIPAAAWAADADTQKAADAASSWLQMVDSGDYAGSWATASSYLQSRISEAQWEQVAKATRDPLGKVLKRDVSSIEFSDTLPGAPDGQYAVVRFGTKFSNKAAAVETVALTMSDGVWKTCGYHLK